MTLKIRIKRIVKWLLRIVLLSIIIGFIYEQISRLRFNAHRPDESEFVSIGDRKLHFKKLGNSPNGTVIFESGMGSDHLHWQEVQPQIAEHFTTISYDRSGILWSDADDEKSLDRITTDLSTLLKNTNCPKPYILVAHSLGGATARQFITEHKEDMAGVIFIDVSHPLQLKKSSEKLKSEMVKPPFWVIHFLDNIGVIRLMYTFQPMNKDVPKDHWFNTNVRDYFYKIRPGFLQEWENDHKLLAEAEKYPDFGDIPLVIITAAYPDGNQLIQDKEIEKEYLSLHGELQKDLLKLSTKSHQIIAEKSGHYVVLQEPDLVVKTIYNIKNQY